VTSENVVRFGNSASPNYFDNRYWTMWKLPMFGCSDASQVLTEVKNCVKASSSIALWL
jgi:ribulose-bisphosphate carboxylase small chain